MINKVDKKIAKRVEEKLVDKMVEMLLDTRQKLNVSTDILCKGICTEEMFVMVTKGNRAFERVTIKRLLARMGVENGNYENYLHFSDYDVWLNRMQIINAIGRSELESAEELLDEYKNVKRKKKSRNSIEEQFSIFMELQILRHKSIEQYEDVAAQMYEEAIKKTVPDIDKAELANQLLSPLEFCLALEYERRRDKYRLWKDMWEMYKRFVSYIEKSPYGKLAKVKVYPKLVVCMYEDIYIADGKKDIDSLRKVYEELINYCEVALYDLKDRQFMYYLTEILEIRIELSKWFKENISDEEVIKRYERIIDETISQLKTLRDTYKEYEVDEYMKDDCYLYRESGMYCIGDVIEKRRKMMHLSRKILCEGICDTRTLLREENRQSVMHKDIFKELFNRLNLNPNYIDTGIVTNIKEDIEMYEELRYAENRFDYEKVKELVSALLTRLPEKPINKMVLMRIESNRKYKNGEINIDEHIRTLSEAIECTVNIENIVLANKNIYLTNEELITLYLMSEANKYAGKYDEAYNSAKQLDEYCKSVEKEDIVAGRVGIYELFMEYLANLYGDMGRFEESNNISDKLIKICLETKRSHAIHFSIYNKAWNNNESKKTCFDFNKELHRCIYFSQLTCDANNEKFYRDKLTSYNGRG